MRARRLRRAHTFWVNYLLIGSLRRSGAPDTAELASDPHFHDYLLFHEYFDGDTGRGLGASHQTGWSALVANMIAELHD